MTGGKAVARPGQGQTVAVPTWSGSFWESSDGLIGYQSIHVADTRNHSCPNGWRLMRSYFDKHDDAEVFVYERGI